MCDAGQDIAQSKEERLQLFTAKGTAGYLAGVFSVVMTLGLSSAFPTSLHKQVSSQGSVAVVVVVGAFICLVLFVREPKTSNVGDDGTRRQSEEIDHCQAIMQVAYNRPFWEYVSSKVLLLVALHLCGAISLYYFKYVLFAENSVLAVSVWYLFGMVMIGLYMKRIRSMMDMERVSVRVLYRNVAVTFSFFHLMFSLLPTSVVARCIYVIMPLYFATLAAASHLLPNHLLALTLDITNLSTGETTRQCTLCLTST